MLKACGSEQVNPAGEDECLISGVTKVVVQSLILQYIIAVINFIINSLYKWLSFPYSIFSNNKRKSIVVLTQYTSLTLHSGLCSIQYRCHTL